MALRARTRGSPRHQQPFLFPSETAFLALPPDGTAQELEPLRTTRTQTSFESGFGNTKWRLELMKVENVSEELWVGVKA
jgi:hypothetical protein